MISLKTTLGIFEIIATANTVAEANELMAWIKTMPEAGEAQQAEPIPDLGPQPVAYEDPVFESTPAPQEPANDDHISVEEAVMMVKAFAARFKPDRAREVMKSVGINRTAEINEDNAAAVARAFKEAA